MTWESQTAFLLTSKKYEIFFQTHLKLNWKTGENLLDFTLNECRKPSEFFQHPLLKPYFGNIKNYKGVASSCPIRKGRIDTVENAELSTEFMPKFLLRNLKGSLHVDTQGVIANKTRYNKVYSWKITFIVWI